jgi:parallel beta-helix repeat protein
VNKTVSIIGNGTTNTTINSGGEPFGILVLSNWVNISGLMVRNADTGIKINGASNVTIENCELVDCTMGIDVTPYETPLFEDDFSTDKGWTGYNTGAGTAQWQRGSATSGGGDPGTDHSYSTDNNIVGNNLGGTYFNNIAATNWLTSPVINCSGYDRVQLSFWRWLGIEDSTWDTVYLSLYDGSTWSNIWQNQNDINENSWNYIVHDVSGYAGNKSNFQVRFGLGPTDASVVYHGWNIDDVKVAFISDTDIARDNLILNTTLSKGDTGIQIFNSEYNTVQNSTIQYFESNEIIMMNSDNNTIYNNNCSFNSTFGISLYNSNYNTIRNNTISEIDTYGIYLTDSYFNDVDFNTISYTIIAIYLVTAKQNSITNNDITKTIEFAIYVERSDNVNVTDNTCSFSDIYGIVVFDSTSVDISNNSVSQSIFGIFAILLFNENIKNNTLTSNYIGIHLLVSQSMTLTGNKMTNCGIFIEGDWLPEWTTHTIDTTNTVNGKPVIYWKNMNSGTVPAGAGEVILANCMNVIVDGQIIENSTVGIQLGLSDNNQIKNNVVRNQNIAGIYLLESDLNVLSKNTVQYTRDNNVINGGDGIKLLYSDNNHITENRLTNNEGSGAYLEYSDNALIEKNTCLRNTKGIYLEESTRSVVRNNNLSNNDNGLFMDWGTYWNKIYENMIAFNAHYGVELNLFDSQENMIYHNNFITNVLQAIDNGTQNNWNSSAFEGNYWSDYAGLDNGSGGRTPGDGIGDTNLPHNGLDDYPFTRPFGWLYPGKPTLNGPTEVDTDGRYTIFWTPIPRALNFILQEDNNTNFDSPTTLYDGPGLGYEVIGNQNDTYYYRLMAYNGSRAGNWSDIFSVIVDWLPVIPGNFKVDVYPEGNALNLTWDLNMVDIKEYELFTKVDSNWNQLETLPHPTNSYQDSGLQDGETYTYKLRAVDFRGQLSDFTPEIEGIPKDSVAPGAPEDLNATATSDSTINLTWTPNPENDIAGYLVYMNDPGSGPGGDFSLIHTSLGTGNSYDVTGLDEQVTYYFMIKAFDEVPNNSTYSNVTSATTPDETPPEAPTGLVVSSPTNDSLTLSWVPNSEDDIVGYNIYHSESVFIGYTKANSEPVDDFEFVDTGLDEITEYFYKITAVDDYGLESDFSGIVNGFTLLNPYPPEINHTMSNVDMLEDTIDSYSINLYFWFKDPNNDPLKFSAESQGNIQVIINHDNGDVTLVPAENWNGLETITFYADDGIYNFSDSVAVNVKSVNDPPALPKITEPSDNKVIKVGEGLSFSGYSSDPDIPYGDYLLYKWESNITGTLGEAQNLTGVLLPAGKHRISLWAVDASGATKISSINITVEKASQPVDGDFDSDDKGSSVLVPAIIIIVVIVVVIIVLFFFMRKKKLDAEEPEEEGEMQPAQFPQMGPPMAMPLGQQQMYPQMAPGYGAPMDPMQQQALMHQQMVIQQQQQQLAQQQMMMQQQGMGYPPMLPQAQYPIVTGQQIPQEMQPPQEGTGMQPEMSGAAYQEQPESTTQEQIQEPAADTGAIPEQPKQVEQSPDEAQSNEQTIVYTKPVTDENTDESES